MITPGFIIGSGRIGHHLYQSNQALDTLLQRGQTVPPESSGPIYVCTRNNDLAPIIDSVPLSRRRDLVFLQNGMLSEFFEKKGLREYSQALIYYAIAKKGDTPIDGKTDLNPEGLTAVTGKWAEDFAARMQQAGLSCHVYDSSRFQLAMLEKLIWISAFMVVGASHGGCTVGDVEKMYSAEVRALIKELAAATEDELSVHFDQGVENRLCAYARSVAHFPTALKEFEWRNGWFVQLSQKGIRQKGKDPCPLHTSLLIKAAPDLLRGTALI
eukprot:gene4177-4590_t